MRLFNAVVTPSVLYGCSSWALTESKEKALASTQTKMVRWMMQKNRRLGTDGELEAWPTYVQRATQDARHAMREYKVVNWVEAYQKQKEKWKARVEQMDPERWAFIAFDWQPLGYRSQGRPRKRWSDDFSVLV